MTTERAAWWKAFLPKRKSGGSKDNSSANSFEPDFDPFAQRPKDPAAGSKNPTDASQSNNSSSLLSDDTYDDSHMESVFNEQTCRRKMKVSRSGRFKEKRRVRSSLPIQENETETGAPGREDVR